MKNDKKNSRNHAGLMWIALGLLLIAAALSLVFYNMCDDQRARQSALRTVSRLVEYIPSEKSLSGYIPSEDAAEAHAASEKTDESEEATGEQEPSAGDEPAVIPDYIICPDMEMPVETIEGRDYIGVLEIPALELELPVISQWSYPDLKNAPCRYSGSAYLNNLIICGHNYTSHFGNLKNLCEGDIATFTDMNGNVFTYRMVERETLQPTSIDAMESGDWDLTLFTCTVGGKSRVTVRFELAKD